MARPPRVSGINGDRIIQLRRRERWTQTDLGNRLGVHRATLARWEAGEGDPPFEVAEKLAELFKVNHNLLFYPPADHEEDAERLDRIRDSWLRHIPLAKLQKFTRPALKASGLTLKQLARKVQELSVQRIQELMDGQKPTVYEIQLLKDRLGALFNPVSSTKKRIQAPTKEDELIALKLQVAELKSSVERLEIVQLELVLKIEQLLQQKSTSSL